MAIRMPRILPLAALTTVSLSLAAQSTGVTTADLKGFAISLSPAGEVPGVTLRLANAATNQTRVLSTDAKGEFIFRLLPPGMYTLTVEKAGFKTQIIKEIKLSLGSTANVDLLMETSEAGAVVEVTADATSVDPTRTQVSTVVDNNLINNLPINRRNFVDFSLTTPGVATANSPQNGGAAANSGLTFAGVNPRLNNVMVDGMDNNDISVGSVRSTFSQEAIQEFQVVTNGFSAEYGKAAGGTVNVITKSGGNAFSGSTFYFRRDGKLDAKRPLATGKTPFTQSQYGATASGALVKDKFFYFMSVERFQKRDTNNITIDDRTALALKQFAGVTVLQGAVPFDEVTTTGIVKLDWNQSADSRWSLRGTWAKEYNENQLEWGGLTDRSAGGARRIEDKSISLSNQWNASSKFVNDFRYLWSLRDHALLSLDPTNGPTISLVGLATVGTQRFLPQTRTEKTIQVADTGSFFLDKHTLKVGIDLMKTNLDAALPLNFAGIYRFQGLNTLIKDGVDALQTANPYGGFGLPAAFVQGFGNPRLGFDTKYYSAFLQDDWQITPKFTLKVGLRYDKEELPAFRDVVDYDALDNPDYTSAGATLGPRRLASGSIGAVAGAVDATVSGGPYDFNELLHTQRNWSSSKVSPRISFTWQAKDALRVYGGYGVFTGRTQLGPFGAVMFSNGTDVVTTIRTAAGGASPWATWANADGGSNRRYASFAQAGGQKLLLLPGKYRMPETKQSTLGFEWTPRPSLRVSLDLVHSNGENFMQVRDVNAPIPNPYFNSAQPETASNPRLRRPDLRYLSILRYDGTGESRYDGGTLGLGWQAKEALQLTASYTLSRTRDNYIDWLTEFSPTNTFDPNTEWGPSNQDMRHKLTASAVINTKGSNRVWAKDWVIAFIGKITSGRPYSRYVGLDSDYGILKVNPADPTTWKFYGNGDGGGAVADRAVGVGRNSETTPMVQNLDLRVSRVFGLAHGAKFELIAEVFNVFNHYNVSRVQNLQGPSFSPNATYGQPIVQSAVDFNRQFQGGMKLTF